MNTEKEKELAANAAVGEIEDGMVVGLGSGSTAAYAIKSIGRLVRDGMKLTGIASSRKTENLAKSENIPIVALESVDYIDLNIDGADEFDPYKQLIKGGGGALLREKVIAHYSKRSVIIVDSRKQVCRLGAFKLPVEVIQFAHKNVISEISAVGMEVSLRMANNSPYLTDEGNFILDLDISKVTNVAMLDDDLRNIPGLIETGLFVDLVDRIYLGDCEEVKVID